MANSEKAVSRQTKLRLALAAGGVLVSLCLLAGSALSLEGGPSPTPGDWTLLLFIPFVILNPVYLLMIPLGITGLIPEVIVLSLGIVLDLCWWWFIAGVAAKFIISRRSC